MSSSADAEMFHLTPIQLIAYHKWLNWVQVSIYRYYLLVGILEYTIKYRAVR